MRIGELLALKVADIDFNTSQISITKTISSDADSRFELHKPKTTTGNRIISVDPDTINLVSTLIKDKKRMILFLGSMVAPSLILLEQLHYGKIKL
ncbi:hypothetical protein V8V50_10105 [Ligilactobacillus salivarius]